MSTSVEVITDPEGADSAEHWSAYVEGKDHGGVGLSWIHLSTTRVGVGPPLHRHHYVEVIEVRRGEAEFTVGSETLTARAGMTVILPADTPHTFRTRDAGRYESVAHHLSPEFVTEQLAGDTDFR